MGNRTASRRSLITDIVTVQLVITGAITMIALAGLGVDLRSGDPKQSGFLGRTVGR